MALFYRVIEYNNIKTVWGKGFKELTPQDRALKFNLTKIMREVDNDGNS